MTIARMMVILGLNASGFNSGMYLALSQLGAFERG